MLVGSYLADWLRHQSMSIELYRRFEAPGLDRALNPFPAVKVDTRQCIWPSKPNKMTICTDHINFTGVCRRSNHLNG